VRCARGAAGWLCLAVALGGATAAAAPPRPQACQEVAPGVSLADAVRRAPAGGALCLAPGVYRGRVRVDRPLTLWGPRDAVIRSEGEGSSVSLEAPGAALLGVSVDGSGGRFDLLDAAVRVEADDVRVEGVYVENALFGLLVEKARRVTLRGNEIEGDADKALGMRGDGIRMWEVRDSRVEDNVLRNSRDIVVWYSPGNRIAGNRVEGGRYGTHFMYSHDNLVDGNRYDRNVVGVFIMYSRGITMRKNVLARSAGAAGIGLGTKDSGNLRVEDNLFAGDHIGAYLDTSPLYLDDHNVFQGNSFRLCDTALVFHGGAERNRFTGNEFRDNRAQVAVEGRGDARAAQWLHNHFDDYAGFDLDGDGIGDLPYELRSLTTQLAAREPGLAFFRGSPALSLVELVGQVVPLFRAETLLVDPEPRMYGLSRELPGAD
jgi:nitrous oxidase accessory protein